MSESTDGTTPEKKPDTTEEKPQCHRADAARSGQRLNHHSRLSRSNRKQFVYWRADSPRPNGKRQRPTRRDRPAGGSAGARARRRPAHPGESPSPNPRRLTIRIKKLEGQVAKFDHCVSAATFACEPMHSFARPLPIPIRRCSTCRTCARAIACASLRHRPLPVAQFPRPTRQRAD